MLIWIGIVFHFIGDGIITFDAIWIDNNFNLSPLTIKTKFKTNLSNTREALISTDTPSSYGQSLGLNGNKLEAEYQQGFTNGNTALLNDT